MELEVIRFSSGTDSTNGVLLEVDKMASNPYEEEFDVLKSELSKLEKYKKKITGSGYFWYPPNSYLGWHTNSNGMNSERIYLVWSDKDNQSFFRYKDPKSGKIVTKWEKSGWQTHRFLVGGNNPLFWHCVGNYSNRVSLGFKIIQFTKPKPS